MREIEFHCLFIRKTVKIARCRSPSLYFVRIHTCVMPNKLVGSAPSDSKVGVLVTLYRNWSYSERVQILKRVYTCRCVKLIKKIGNKFLKIMALLGYREWNNDVNT